MYAILSRVSFWGVPFTQYHILFSLCRQAPFKKGNSQTESSVQGNPAAPSPCQYGYFRVVPCPLPLEYQAASSQARLKSCWAIPGEWGLKVVRPWLVCWACRASTRDFFSALAALVAQCKIFFSSPYIISIPLSLSTSELGRQTCWVVCLLVCVSGQNP